MFTNPEDHGRQCPNCDNSARPTKDAAENPTVPKEVGGSGAGQSNPVHDTLKTFLLSEEEFALLKPQIIAEIERRAPQFLKSATIAALLPLLQPRAQRYYEAQGVPHAEAEELASQFTLKALKVMFGHEVRGKSGALLTMMRNNVLVDFWRAKKRSDKRLAHLKEEATRQSLDDAPVDEASIRLFIEDLPAEQREVIERLLGDPEWEKIASDAQKKIKEATKTVQSLQWEEGSVPLRKKRR